MSRRRKYLKKRLFGGVVDCSIYITVDLKKLIENIYISPKAEKWFPNLVKSIVDKYKLNMNVVKSPLLADIPADFGEKGNAVIFDDFGVMSNSDSSGNTFIINEKIHMTKASRRSASIIGKWNKLLD